MRPLRSIAFAIGLLPALLPAPALGQDAATRARELFELGVSAMDGGNPVAAEQHFQQSFQLSPRASTACNMATAQEQLGRPCEAQSWYRQCASLDTTGAFRERANAQASALSPRCPPQDPFVRTPTPQPTTSTTTGGVQIVEGGVPTRPTRSVDHTLLGVGIGGLVLAGGALAGGILFIEAAHGEANAIVQAEGTLVEGTEDADRYDRATTYSNVGLAFYAGAGVLAALGTILILIDLAQPGSVDGSASNPAPQLALQPLWGGAHAELRMRF